MAAKAIAKFSERPRKGEVESLPCAYARSKGDTWLGALKTGVPYHVQRVETASIKAFRIWLKPESPGEYVTVGEAAFRATFMSEAEYRAKRGSQ
jgi:hypothetical protein